MALQCSQRLPELLFYMKKSYRILQLQFYKGTHTPSTSMHAHYKYIQRILHPDYNSTCRRQRALRVLLLHTEDLHSRFQKRNSTHRRQEDLLEIHPCVLQDLQDIPVFPDIPVVHGIPAFQAILQIPLSPGNPPHYSILQLECIFYIFYNFYSLIGFHRNSTEYQLNNYKHSTNITFFKEREMLRYQSN